MIITQMIKDYLFDCQYRKALDWKTIKAYRIDLRQYANFVKEQYMDRQTISTYIAQLHEQFKPKTVKRKIASIRAFYHYLEEENEEFDNPFHKIKVKFKEPVVLPRTIPRHEIERLLNYLYKNLGKSKRILCDIAIVETLFATGVRVYEISNLRLSNINLTTGVIKIMGKGAKERYIQIVDRQILGLLRQYFRVNQNQIQKKGYFFINENGNRYSEQSIRMMLKKYVKQIGISLHITPHMFRHSFATYLIEEGADISYVKELLGHSSIKTTQIYIHLALNKQVEILRKLHPRNKLNILCG